jgi:hypothetical protein
MYRRSSIFAVRASAPFENRRRSSIRAVEPLGTPSLASTFQEKKWVRGPPRAAVIERQREPGLLYR